MIRKLSRCSGFWIIGIFLSTTPVVLGQTVWYVDDNSTGGFNNGLDWANAFTELQSALAVAGSGDEIRVAQGVYKPDYDLAGGVHTGDRDATFTLIDGVKLYGGYAGFGTVNPDLRDVVNRVTILSGDLAGNDEPDFVNNEENSYHVLSGSFISVNSVLDGFTVIGGNAPSGGGLYNSSNSNITINNCVFSRNYATYHGGGIYNTNASSPVITNCTFKDNSAGCDDHLGGGGIANYQAGTPLITGCSFVDNHAFGHGAGIQNVGCDPKILSCRFTGNTAVRTGGGICNISSGAMIRNCTLNSNSAVNQGGGIYNLNSGNTVISQCIFWDNLDSDGSNETSQVYNYSCTPSLQANCIQGLDAFSGNDNIGDDPLLIADGYHLQSTSPCINKWGPVNFPPDETDIDGESRVDNTYYDIGCDEFIDTDSDGMPDWWEKLFFGSITAALRDGDPDLDGISNLDECIAATDPLELGTSFFVSVTGDDAWDGLAREWDGSHGPKRTIQAGIDIAGLSTCRKVVLLPGVYTGPGNRDLDYGGKPIVVMSVNPDNPQVVMQTVIDCQGTASEPHRGFYFHNDEGPDSVLSGITIRGGYFYGGGAIRCDRCNPNISNCVFTLNRANSGGAIHNNNSSPTISRCRFDQNLATSQGGGVYNVSGNPTLIECLFQDNYAAVQGGGIYSDGCENHELNNCEFRGNCAGLIGGGVSDDECSNSTFTNCSFVANLASVAGGGMVCSSDSVISNCAFVGNTAGWVMQYKGAGGIHCLSSSPTLVNCILWDNRSGYDTGESAQVTGGSASLTYCCIQGLNQYGGNGNIGDAPCLLSDGIHLRSDSPCVNQGDPNGTYAGQVDADGEQRVLAGRVDIGIDEFADTDTDDLPDWWEELYFDSPLAALPDDDPDGNGKSNFIEYTDGTHPLREVLEFYVSTTGDDSWDGLAPSRDNHHGPKATIQGGIDAMHSREGDTLTILPGTYSGVGNRDISYKGKSVTLQSIEPGNPGIVSETIIDCEGSSDYYRRGFLFTNCKEMESVLNGITITNGYTLEGGAVLCVNSSPVIKNCVFLANTAIGKVGGGFRESGGGGMSNLYSTPCLVNCRFNLNKAFGSGSASSGPVGGGMYNSFSNSIIDNCLFLENSSAENGGGGMYNEESAPRITNCKFIRNSSEGNSYTKGGGLYNVHSEPVLTNCLFNGNFAEGIYSEGYGGGVCNTRSSPEFVNCTFVHNQATEVGGGFYNRSESHPVLTNCILWGNTDDGGNTESAQIYNLSGDDMAVVSNSCVQGLDNYTGMGNIGLDPLFVDSTGVDGVKGNEDDNLRLQKESPCVNGGDNTAVTCGGGRDLDGQLRIHACVVDMGAYEDQQARFFADMDENCVIDLNDYLDFNFCLERFGHEKNSILELCAEVFDADGDEDVDLADFAAFQRVFAEPRKY